MNTFDEERRRATFGLTYPLDDLEFVREDRDNNFQEKTKRISDEDLKSYVKAKRLSFNLNNATFRNIIFDDCNFHNMKGKSMAEISKVSFENCDFNKNIMGTTEYFRVIFKNCNFNRCDFMNADFKECIFENCEFKECTAYHCRFIDTKIDPPVFLSSIKLPTYNFDSVNEETRIHIERERMDQR